MPQISEKWEVTVGKNKHILSGKEKDALLNAGDVRFVSFRGVIINPAFVQDIVLVASTNELQIEAPEEVEVDPEQLQRNRQTIAQMKEAIMRKTKISSKQPVNERRNYLLDQGKNYE